MPNWTDIGMGAAANVANTAIGAGLGLMLEKHNDKRQIAQQQKLQALQIAGQKELTDYNTGKQMEMWRNTSYPAQMEMLKQAGLNPGLIYGMGGGGGQSTNIAQGNVTGAEAPKGGQEAMGMGMQMMQAQAIQSQIELTKAQTEKTKAEAGAIPTQVKKTEAETASITQGIENQKVQAELIEAQRYATNVAADINARSSNSQVANWAKDVEIKTEQIRQMMRDNGINDQLINEKIQALTAEYKSAAVDNALKEAQTNRTAEEINAIKQQIALNKPDEQMAADGSNPKAGTLMKWLYMILKPFETIGRARQ